MARPMPLVTLVAAASTIALAALPKWLMTNLFPAVMVPVVAQATLKTPSSANPMTAPVADVSATPARCPIYKQITVRNGAGGRIVELRLPE